MLGVGLLKMSFYIAPHCTFVVVLLINIVLVGFSFFFEPEYSEAEIDTIDTTACTVNISFQLGAF